MPVSRVDARSPHVYLYDGVCALCSRAVRFLLRHDRRERFRFSALQGPFAREALARHGERAAALDTFWVVRDAGTRRETVLSRSRAVLFAWGELGFPWRALALLAVVPRAVLDPLYDAIARSRYRLFGRYEQCALAPTGFERRFIDVDDSAPVAESGPRVATASAAAR
jgi:predicted DCC family thiol-disulfide oxidoreductase YuxK